MIGKYRYNSQGQSAVHAKSRTYALNTNSLHRGLADRPDRQPIELDSAVFSLPFHLPRREPHHPFAFPIFLNSDNPYWFCLFVDLFIMRRCFVSRPSAIEFHRFYKIHNKSEGAVCCEPRLLCCYSVSGDY